MTDDINKKDENATNEAPSSADNQLGETSIKNNKSSRNNDDDQIDFDKEINDLDEFLMESEHDEDLLLNDDDDQILTASSFNRDKKSGSGAGKFVGYGLLAVLLGGIAYGGVKYGPQLLNNSEMDTLQQNLANRSGEIMGEGVAETAQDGAGEFSFDTAPIASNDNSASMNPSMEGETPNTEPLPVAADETNAETIADNENDIILSGDVSSTDSSAPASTIADALALAQTSEAENPDLKINSIANTDTSETTENASATDRENTGGLMTSYEDEIEISNDTSDTQEILEDNSEAMAAMDDATQEDVGFERTQAMPMSESANEVVGEENLPPLEEDQIKIANDIMLMPEDQLIEVVEASDKVVEKTREAASKENVTIEAEEALIEKAVNETVKTGSENTTSIDSDELSDEVAKQTEEAVTNSVASNAVIDAEDVAEMEIDVTSDTEAESKMDDPSSVVINEVQAPNKQAIEEVEVSVTPAVATPTVPKVKVQPADPRLEQAQAAYSRGEYSKAMELYNAVLMKDPSDTRALTGRQLATAKVRTSPQNSMMATPSLNNAQDVTVQTNPIVSGPVLSVETSENNLSASQRLRERLKLAGSENSSANVEKKSFVMATPSPAITAQPAPVVVKQNSPAPVEPVKESSVFKVSNEPYLPPVKSQSISVDSVVFEPSPLRETISQPETRSEPVLIAPSPVPVSENTRPQIRKVSPQPEMITPMVQPSATDLNPISAPVTEIVQPAAVQARPEPMPIMQAPSRAQTKTAPTAAVPAAQPTQLQSMIAEADANPENAALAVAIGDAFKSENNMQQANEWYRKALKSDAMYKTGLDRMSIYDRLAGVK